ncbi:MAG: N-acetylmuramoyl-L-alanine amidase, partial [Candidatus Thermochlorobacter sp.]
MEIAARENATSERNIGELKNLIKKIMLNSKIKESKEFATEVINKIALSVGLKYNRKKFAVKKAPFYVLIGAQMPAILVEVSYL